MKKKNLLSRVYVIWNPELQRTKIGYSKNPKTRCETLINASGCNLKLIHYTEPLYNYIELENDMHTLFKDVRGIGEWFNLHYKNIEETLRELSINTGVYPKKFKRTAEATKPLTQEYLRQIVKERKLKSKN